MSSPVDERSDMPDHVSGTVDTLAQLHAAHMEKAGALENSVRATTRLIGKPCALLVFVAILVFWVTWNQMEVPPALVFDEAPFDYLDHLATIFGVLIAMLVLITQQRDDVLAERRDQLILELAAISDLKSSKIISLLEELRNDLPNVANRKDTEANEMTKVEDPSDLLGAIKAAHIDRGKDGNERATTPGPEDAKK